jgi:TIR domain
MSDEFDDEAKLRKAIENLEVSPVVKRFGDWVVTTYGIECLKIYYPIELSRVNKSDWVRHMSEKEWVNIRDFAAALDYAKHLYAMRHKLALDGRPLKIFLCHGSQDKPSVRELRHRLLAIGTAPWLDEEELLPGQNWKLAIGRALRKSDIVLACLSKETVSKTGFVQRELKEALDAAAERPEGQIFIIPARFDECTLPDSLQGLQWVDLFTKDGFERLTRALELFSSSRTRS